MTSELQALNARLDRLEKALDSREGIMVSALDGFIAALWLLPEQPPQVDWLAAVLDIGEDEDDEALASLVKLVLEHYQGVGYALRTEAYAPLFAVGDDDPETVVWQIWAEGFGNAVGFFSEAFEPWVADSSETGNLFRIMIMLTGIALEDEDFARDIDTDELAAMVAEAPEMIVECLYGLHAARLEEAGALVPRRRAPAPGRNDLCPCGSGKKFKKCCGA